MAELSAVPFSALPQTSDGYTVLYENNQVCRSEKKLSELVGDKTSSFLTREEGDSLYQEKGNYLVADDITGKLDKSQYAVDSATFLTAHQDISNKLDTSAFSTVSGNFLTAVNLDEYATQEWVNNQGFLKEHQPISADEWNDVYETVVSNSGTWETETDWTDDINDASAYAYEQVIAQIPAPFDPTFLSGEIDKKLDKTFSSNFYPMSGNPSGFLTDHQDISNKLDTTSFSTVSGTFLTDEDITGKMDKSESANFYPMTGNPSGFATIDYVDTKIGKIGSFEVVGLNEENEPDVDEPSTKIIYLTKETDSEKTDPYTEWIYNDTTSAWECIGETTLDLIDYYKKTETSGASEISDAFNAKQDKLTAGTDIVINNEVIGVNTNGSAIGDFAFVEGKNTFAGGLCDHVEGMGGIADNGGMNHIEGFQYHSYCSNGPATNFNNTNIVKFTNVCPVILRNNDRISPNGTLYELVKIFKDRFIVSCEYGGGDGAGIYHYTQNSFYNPELYKIIDVDLDSSTNEILITIDGKINVPGSSNGFIQLYGPTTIKSIYGKSDSLSSGQTLNTFIFNGLGSPGNCLDNVRLDNTFISINLGYTKTGEQEPTTISKIIEIKKIEFDSSNNSFTFTTEDIEIPDIVGGRYTLTLYVINSTYNGCDHIEGQDNSIHNGCNSHAEGFCNTITNNCSHVEGSFNYASNQNSHAEGYQTSANGNYSHAEGQNTKAIKQGTHAEGYKTSANGMYSHAEGSATLAAGSASHSEGFNTLASKEYAHAEGYQTSAIYYAHSEGWKTRANEGGHAEGGETFAGGKYSHAEGQETKAITNNTHSEGGYTSAGGYCSHAEGYKTVATGFYSHSEGNSTSAYEESCHAEGQYTIASGKGSHAEGGIYDTNIGAYVGTSAIGKASHTEGLGTIAGGMGSHAEGSATIASGMGSHAEGLGTTALGQGSHTEGGSTKAYNLSHAEGSQTLASGVGAHSEGQNTSANSDYSHAEGIGTIASGMAAHAEGISTSAIGIYAHAEGNGTSAYVANEGAAHAEGYKTSATVGLGAHAEGWYSIASGNAAHAEGIGTSALSSSTHSEGSATLAAKACAHAEGYQTTANYCSHSEGYLTYASGRYSHTEGCNTSANSDYSHSEGLFSLTISGYPASHAEGYNTTASGDGSHSEGRETLAQNVAAHAEGYYTSANGYGSHSEGNYTSAYGQGSHSEGSYTTAISLGAHAEGGKTKAIGSYSHSEGYKTSAVGSATHSEGFETSAVGDYSHSNGYYTIANNSAQFVCGKYNDDVEDSLFLIGNGKDTSARSNAFIVTNEGLASATKIATSAGELANVVVTGEFPEDKTETTYTIKVATDGTIYVITGTN